MTLDKHKIEGLQAFTHTTLPVHEFESRMVSAGYMLAGSAPAQGKRFKFWWTHPSYPRVESIYSSDKTRVITAYHV